MADDKSAKLDSVAMNQILKGDVFPGPDAEDDTVFMDDNIESFFDNLLARSQIKKSDVIRNANIARAYGYQIFSGERIAQRDYYLRIAIAMKLDLRTTQRLLAVAKVGSLHSLLKRDAAIIFAINHGYDNIQTYDFMQGLDLTPLERDETEAESELDPTDD